MEWIRQNKRAMDGDTMGKHMVRLNFLVEDTCRWCRETIEDSYQFLHECPALFHRRFNTLGSYFLQNLSEIKEWWNDERES